MGTKVIVVSRNPLDACVSAYYHAWNPAKSGWPFSAWAAAWLSGNVPHGSWFDWVRRWHGQSQLYPDRVLWLQYEDLKHSSSETVKRIADFIGVESDPELIRLAVEKSSFDSMCEQAQQKGGDKLSHLRKGVAGDWCNHFSEELAEDFFTYYREQLSGTGIIFSLGGEGAEERFLSAP